MDWQADPNDDVEFGNGALVVDFVEQGPHLRVDMSDGGAVWLAWTDFDDLASLFV